MPVDTDAKVWLGFNYTRNMNRLTEEAHLDFHTMLLTIIKKYGVEPLHLDPHIDTYIYDIESERVTLQTKCLGNIARYMTARYSTDRQCRRMIHVVYMFSVYMPSQELDSFITELNDLLKSWFRNLRV